jgi:hypothetical protein
MTAQKIGPPPILRILIAADGGVLADCCSLIPSHTRTRTTLLIFNSYTWPLHKAQSPGMWATRLGWV